MRPDYTINSLPIQKSDQLGAAVTRRDRLELSLIKTRLSFKPGSYPIRAGEKSFRVLIHRFGLIQRISPLGIDNSLESENTAIHWVYGLTETLSEKEFMFSVRTITPAQFDVIERDDLFEFMRRRPEVVRSLNIILCDLYRNAVSGLLSNERKKLK